MTIWTLLITVVLWPGRQLVARLPNLGPAETRLVHNITNYVVWLCLICGGLIWVLLATMPGPG